MCIRDRRAAAARAAYDRDARFGPDAYSWLIYRATNPTIRELFMHPRNDWRVKEALLSLLAGDIYGSTPIWRGVATFKAIYYAVSAAHPRRTFRAWRRRKNNIRDTGPLAGENVMDA